MIYTGWEVWVPVGKRDNIVIEMETLEGKEVNRDERLSKIDKIMEEINLKL